MKLGVEYYLMGVKIIGDKNLLLLHFLSCFAWSGEVANKYFPFIIIIIMETKTNACVILSLQHKSETNRNRLIWSANKIRIIFNFAEFLYTQFTSFTV